MNARRCCRIALLGLCLGLTPSTAPGDDTGPATRFGTVGPEFQVNSYTTLDQRRPAVAADAVGDFVVVWQSDGSGGTDTWSWSIQGQRYASDGSALGGEFQVNSYTTDRQERPAVAMDADGDFVVLWDSDGSGGTDSSSKSIQGQRYASDGSALGGEFQVNSYTTANQSAATVAMDADGDFVVVWQSFGSGGTDSASRSIQGQRYASDGSALGGQFQVNSYITEDQDYPAVAMDADGDFVVAWRSFASAGPDTSESIQGQRYASDGSAVGGEFQVNTYTTDDQEDPAVGMDADGDFVVVWDSYGSGGTDSSDYSIQGQRYASDGSALGVEFQVNTYTTDDQGDPAVTMDADGNFVVVWDSYGSGGTDSSDVSVQGQRYASDGSALGGELQVNSYTTSGQFSPAVAVQAGSDFVVVWDSDGSGGTDSSDRSIQGQRAGPGEIFADGFESGNTSAWSSTVGGALW